ncbi:MAG: hypothetical protein NTW16_14775 [Bacteroidetes bacterium]|nr:hypothetical protein [Bacteroidota bacterium]
MYWLVQNELEEKFNELLGSITEKFESMQDEAGRMVKKGRHEVEEVEAEVVSAVTGKK